MKMIKTLTCAIAAAAAVALSASTSHAAPLGVATNYDIITLSLTIKTNYTKVTGPNKASEIIVSEKFVTKNLLALLSGPDFANTSFPSNALLAIDWDLSPWESHVVVIDKSGNIYYDVNSTTNNVNNTNNLSNFTLDLAQLRGAESGTANVSTNGGENITAYNTGYFVIDDNPTGTNSILDLFGYGPSTQKYSIAWKGSVTGTNVVSNTTSWSSSFNFTPQGANQTYNGFYGGTMSGTINVSGHGKTTPYSLNIGSLGSD